MSHALRNLRLLIVAVVALVALSAVAAEAQQSATQQLTNPGSSEPAHVPESVPLKQALVALPIAGLLGAALAIRPQRRGTPPRQAAVIQTQIILSLVGALVMLVVGASLARAFGIVGAASLVRYRAKVDDPKDAGIMLSCLTVGLASGVGVYWLATFSTIFILAVVWVLESLEPKTRKEFFLKIKVPESADIRAAIEGLLKTNKLQPELRGSSAEDVSYSVKVPLSKKTDALTNAILDLGPKDQMAVEWSDKKPKDKA
ncbi:MAG: MgtC/SapB family protein [Vicinamibacteria bacterium]